MKDRKAMSKKFNYYDSEYSMISPGSPKNMYKGVFDKVCQLSDKHSIWEVDIKLRNDQGPIWYRLAPFSEVKAPLVLVYFLICL
jgi:hypothetical protein